eukprot:6004657-Karenia_brevis.AAC.1
MACKARALEPALKVYTSCKQEMLRCFEGTLAVNMERTEELERIASWSVEGDLVLSLGMLS